MDQINQSDRYNEGERIEVAIPRVDRKRRLPENKLIKHGEIRQFVQATAKYRFY